MKSRTHTTAMLVALMLYFFSIVTQCSNTSASGLLAPIFMLNATSQALTPHAFTTNATRFATLAAPLYGNVTAGDIWVFPSSANDLGAREMSCECFDPGNQCCIAEASDVAPFCMPSGSTCCGNTFCVAGESCCGEFCCAANTACNFNAALGTSGCCPIGTICSGPAICYDHASSNCSSRASPFPQCCPARVPYCRDFKPYGLGCYGSSTTESSTSSLQTMTAAGTSNIFASSVSAASPSKSTGVGSESVKTTSVLESTTNLAIATAAVKTTSESAKETNTVSSSSTSTTSLVTTSSSTSTSNAQSTSAITSTTSAMTTSSSTSASNAKSTSAATITTSSSSIVALCYDPAANSHSPCPTTTATTSSSASPSTADFNPPGASIVKSQAGKLRIPLLGPLRDLYRSSYQRFTSNGRNTDLFVSLLAIFVLAIYIPLISLRLLRIWRNDKDPRISNFAMHMNIILLALVAVALDLLTINVRGPYESDWTVRTSHHLLAVGAGFTLGCIFNTPFYYLTKKSRSAIVKAWLRNERGYTATQARGIMAGPDHENLEPDSDLDLKLNLDLQTEKLKDAITVVQGSAKPLLEKKVVGKGQISVVKGSARPWVRGRRTHSLWEAKAKARARSAGVVEGVEGVEGAKGGEGTEAVEAVETVEGEGEGQGQSVRGVDDEVDN